MVDEGASDLFFSTHANVSMKVMGKLHPVSKQKFTSEQVQAILFNLVDEEKLQEFHDTLELNFAISLPEIGRFRANAFRQRGDIALVIRHIKTEIPKVSDINLSPILNDLVAHKNGLVIVAGATGSGKSTSLAAMIGYRNTNIGGHILTIEDLVEFIHSHKKAIVNQREVGLDTLNYSNALQSLDRIFNFFPKNSHRQLSEDLSRNLRAIISQHLIPGKDGNLYPAVEILINTPYVTKILQQGKLEKLPEAMEQRAKYGMATFDEVLYKMYKAGTIDVKTAL